MPHDSVLHARLRQAGVIVCLATASLATQAQAAPAVTRYTGAPLNRTLRGNGHDMTKSAAEQEVWDLEHASWNYLRAGDLDGYMSLFHESVVGWPNNQVKPLDIRRVSES